MEVTCVRLLLQFAKSDTSVWVLVYSELSEMFTLLPLCTHCTCFFLLYTHACGLRTLSSFNFKGGDGEGKIP